MDTVWGGRLTVLFTKDHPDVKAICVSASPASFEGTMYEQLLSEWKKEGFFERVSGRDKKSVRIPYAYVVDQQRIDHDTLEAARLLIKPQALVVAGDADTEVPWQETKKVFDALNCPKEFLLLEGVEHRYKYQPNIWEKVHEPIVSFFQKYL